MKLHQLHIENLNSLRGTHHIDFERLFSVSTIVLIAGETGAGKSTILDAVHLAIFGRTPRLQSPAGSTRNEQGVEHVMTRGTGHCEVTLEFSVLAEDGIREKYQAIWRLHRAHRKAEGRVQSPSQSLARYDEASGKYVDMLERGEYTSLSAARNQVLRGMSEQDFVRSVLLPQGQFDALLNADEQTRSDALKRIVPVDHIEEIGKKVGEFASAAKSELDNENNRLGVQEEALLSDEDRDAFVKKLETLQTDTTKQEAAAKVLHERVQWQDRDQELRRAEAESTTKLQEITKEQFDASDDREALKEHERLNDAWGVWTRCAEIQKDAKTRREAFEAAEKEAKAQTVRFKEAEQRVKDAQKALDEQRAAQKKLEPTLKEAEAAWETLEKQQHAHKRADDLHARAKLADDEQTTRLTARKEALHASEKALEIAQDNLARFEMSTEAPAAQPAIEDLLRRGERLQYTHEMAVAPVQNATKNSEELEKEAESFTKRTQKHESDVAQWVKNARSVHASAPWTVAPPLHPPGSEHSEAVSFDAPDQWTEQLNENLVQLKDYGVALGDLSKQRRHLAQLAETHTKELEQVQAAEDVRKAAAASSTVCDSSLKEREKLLESLREQLATQNRYLALVEELKNTDACPVCGTENPPTHADDRRRSVEQELAATQTKGKEAARAVAAAKAACETARKALEHAQQKKLIAETRAKTIETAITKATEDAERQREVMKAHALYAHIPPADEVEALEQQLVDLRTKYTEINEATKRCRDLRDAGSNLKLAAEGLKTQREHLQKQQKSALGERKRANAALKDAEEALQTWMRSARSALDTPNFVRWQCKRTDNLNDDVIELLTSLETVSSTLKKYIETQRECTRLREHAAKETTELKAQEKDAGEAKKALEAADKALKEASATVEAAQIRTKTYFDGTHPREVEAGWKKTIEAHQNALDTQREALEATQTTYQAAVAARDNAKTRRDDNADALRTENDKLQALLKTLDIDTAETLVARRLGEVVAEKIKTALADIDKRCNEAKTAHRIASESLKAHQARLEEIGEPTVADADNLAALREKINALHTEIGVVSTQLNADSDRRKALEEAGERLKKLKVEHDEWDVLRQLVGANKGEAFSKFALALSLGELIAHANEQLASIAPRYTLQQRFTEAHVPLIDFEIIDHHFAGEARPISNLSGGERFQLSLAMALGLSSMSRSILPVETLLIDEGFGTLDPVTLDKAIHTLESLYQRTGARVGLISHVERLRERLPTQIIVRKRGNGHSTLDVRDGLAL